VWLLLLVFAVSGFAFNLPRSYAGFLDRITDYDDIQARTELPAPLVDPPVGWSRALALGQDYMAEQARVQGFTVNRPAALIYRRQLGAYFYRVHSSRDPGRSGTTTVGIDATTGALTGVQIPTGHRTGNTLTTWIKALHTAMVFGWPWKAVVTGMGLVVAMLSVTGVLIWWRKRRARMKRIAPEGTRLAPAS
jgi:uncharacterized iron-regulated membrane protein